MPAIIEGEDESPGELPFPPVTRQHVLNCSFHSWHPKYRIITPKAHLIPLNKPCLDYLRADGIVLPPDDDTQPEWSDDSGIFSASDDADAHDDSDEDDADVTAGWQNIHSAIRSTIAALGGKVFPKLNWSAPKDATWINANSMECRAPNDVYLLLKSSDFITHDLEHAFDDTSDSTPTTDSIPYHLVLRKAVAQWNPSVEFRCFVRGRRLLCMCQRDLNYFDFLSKMSGRLRSLIQEFFDVRLRDTFPDDNFVFDVYVPPPYDRVWLVDFNPWATRTDPLLFGWLEILNMPDPPEPDVENEGPEFVRLSVNRVPHDISNGTDEDDNDISDDDKADEDKADEDASEDIDQDSDIDEDIWLPELRLVRSTDPEAYQFSSTQYSAHKLPKDVVEASQSGEGLREFARDWQNVLARRQEGDMDGDSSNDD